MPAFLPEIAVPREISRLVGAAHRTRNRPGLRLGHAGFAQGFNELQGVESGGGHAADSTREV